MKYKNVSDSEITVEQVSLRSGKLLETTQIKVASGEEFATSPGRAAALLDAGKIVLITGVKPAVTKKKKIEETPEEPAS